MFECSLKCISFARRKIMRMFCVRKYNYNCAHRLDYSPPLSAQPNQNPKCKSTKCPPLPLCPETKIPVLQPAYTGPPGPCQPLTSLLNTPASPIRSCLQFASCLRLFSSSEFCLHHALCLECPSPNFHLAQTFLSFGDAATASKNLVS